MIEASDGPGLGAPPEQRMGASGWSRAATSGLVSIYWLAAPLTLLAEPSVRRFGGFRVIAAGVALAAFATFLLGFCESLTLLFVLRFLMGLGKVMMACGVTLLAAHWFRKNFGLALACCYAGWHFGGLVLVPFTQWLIDTVGWRETSTILSIAIFLVAIPPLRAWARVPSPGSRGIEPESLDLPIADTDTAGSDAPEAGEAISFRRALWTTIAATLLAALAYGAILANEAALVDGQSALEGYGAAAVSATALSALFAAVGVGWLSDRMAFRPLVLLELGLLLCGILGFLALTVHPSLALMFAAAISFGISVGGFEAAFLPNLRRTLSAPKFDRAFGIWYLWYLAALFSAPIAAGWLYDEAQSYQPALVILTITTILAALPAMLVPTTPRAERPR